MDRLGKNLFRLGDLRPQLADLFRSGGVLGNARLKVLLGRLIGRAGSGQLSLGGLEPLCCVVTAISQQPSKGMAVTLLLTAKLFGLLLDSFKALLQSRELAVVASRLEHGIDK